MTAVIDRLDDMGKPAWIALMVLGFIVAWPVGLAILAYLIWSKRMGCRSYANDADRAAWFDQKRERWERKMSRWGMGSPSTGGSGFRPTGNRAFDEYRDETLKKLEAEADEFKAYLERLRMARDKQEFDQYMADRRKTEGEANPA